MSPNPKHEVTIHGKYFFILSTVPDPLRCLNMSKHTKTNHQNPCCETSARTTAAMLLRFKFRVEFVCTKRLNGRTARRIVSILISYNIMVCFGVNRQGDETQSYLVFLSQTEMYTVRAPACFRSLYQCPLRRKRP